jgi:hypothetical protein
MEFDLFLFALQIIVSTILGAPFLWIAGRIFVSGKNARLVDAIWIIIVGNVAGLITGFFTQGLVGFAVQMGIMLFLIKKYFETNYLKALLISVASVIITIISMLILGALGFALLAGWI